MNNQVVKLQNSESGWTQTFITSESGRILEYVEEGDWVIIVDEFESSSGVFEGLRESISVSANTAGVLYDLETYQLADVAINLTSEPSGADLGEMKVLSLIHI